MGLCGSETGGVIGDTFILNTFSKTTNSNDGVKGFRNQLQAAYDRTSSGNVNFSMNNSGQMSKDIRVYMDGANIACKNEPYRISLFLPRNSYSVRIRARTQIECSVKLHIKFIEITDDTHNWTINSFDDSVMAEDQIINQVITYYDSTAYQQFYFDLNTLNGKEGYFILMWANADDIQLSGINPNTDYGFEINYDLSISMADANTWLNTSRTYNVAPNDTSDPYLVPYVVTSTIYNSCSVVGTRCDQVVYTGGKAWRYPCSIENIVVTDVQNNEFTFTYYHDDRFSEDWGGTNLTTAYFTITKISDGTWIDEQNSHVNVANIGTDKYQVIVDARTQNEEYSIDIYYKNTGEGTSDYQTHKTIYITTTNEQNAVVTPTLYFWSQNEATPDVIKTYFAQAAGVLSYDLIVRDPGNNIVFNQNYVDTGNIGEIITISVGGLVFGNLYHFRLIANPDGGHSSGTDYETDVLKTGWLAKTVITLIPNTTSIVVNYTSVPNADNYVIKLRRDGYGQTYEYTGAYNSPYTINGLIFNKGYTVTIDARNSSGVYQYSTEYAHTTTFNPVTYLDKPQVKYTNTGAVSANSDNIMFELKELVNNADRYEIIINGVVTAWNPIVPYNVAMDYGVAYSIIVKAYNDTYILQSESHEINMTLYKKLTTIEPADYIKYAHGPNDDTNMLTIEVVFIAGRGGETLRTTIEDMSGAIVDNRTIVVANNTVDNYTFSYQTTNANEYIIRSWFEIPKTWGGSYEAKSVEKVCRIRTLADTDNDGHADNHPTNPDKDNPNTTFGYGDGLGL